MHAFRELQDRYEIIGDVRTLGAMAGLELVKDRATKEPATELAARVVQEARGRGLLLLKAGTSRSGDSYARSPDGRRGTARQSLQHPERGVRRRDSPATGVMLNRLHNLIKEAHVRV